MAMHEIIAPSCTLWHNLEVSACRYPGKALVEYFGQAYSFTEVERQAEVIAGWLEQVAGIKPEDRVLLYMQNCPQFIIAYYGILRAGAVVVPVNPMNRSQELMHYIVDAGARVAIYGDELDEEIGAANKGLSKASRLIHRIAVRYIDACSLRCLTMDEPSPPEWMLEPHALSSETVTWRDVLSLNLQPASYAGKANDLAVMPYTSGTTGFPKGCMHTHRSVMHTTVGGSRWIDVGPESVVLGALPLFHVTGMIYGMHSPVYTGATVIMMPRWDREIAGKLIAHHRVTHWTNISTMVIDLLGDQGAKDIDLSSLQCINGGGAAMPGAIAQRLEDTYGLRYVEGYGLTETMAPTHSNPMDRPRRQCLGIPFFNTEAYVVDPDSLVEVAAGDVGEIIVRGPQLFEGYWRNPKATEAAFIEWRGGRYFRTGDIGLVDEDGYFYLTDRLKRMINASGFKVWPAEIENILYQHPAIREVCVIGAPDSYRGETVKAVVVLHPDMRGKVSEKDIINWSKGNMAAYKYPRIVQFVETIPKSGTGKVMWRYLQEQERGERI